MHASVSEVVVGMLRAMRGVDEPRMKKRRKKLNITPGKSVSAEDITDVSNSPKVAITRAEKDVADEAMNLQDKEEASTGIESIESAENSATGTGFDNPNNLMAKGENISVGDFVTVKYEGQKFSGKVISIEKDGPLVSALTKCKKMVGGGHKKRTFLLTTGKM